MFIIANTVMVPIPQPTGVIIFNDHIAGIFEYIWLVY